MLRALALTTFAVVCLVSCKEANPCTECKEQVDRRDALVRAWTACRADFEKQIDTVSANYDMPPDVKATRLLGAILARKSCEQLASGGGR